MKTSSVIILSLICTAISLRADLANYQSTVAGQNPAYYFNFDNSSLNDSADSATFTVNGSAAFGNDYFGNADYAVSTPSSSSALTLSSPNIIHDAGSTTSVGSLSLLFNLSSVGGTRYLFSDSENTSSTSGATGAAASALSLAFSGGTWEFKVGNKSLTDGTTLPAPSAGVWYYFAATWDFDGTSADQVNWYIGEVGGALVSGNNLDPNNTHTEAVTATVGDGGTFVLGGRRSLSSGAPGEYDELATFSTELSSDQIQSQFDALTTVPEPSIAALLGAGALLGGWAYRKKLSAR